jgi:hypothetical protein
MDQTTEKANKKKEHIYLKFLTPLTPSVEKIVDLYGFKEVYEPNKYKCIIQSIRIMRAWQYISPEVIVKGFKCCISKGMDGTDDEMLWNGSEGDGNVRNECTKAMTGKMETVLLVKVERI